MGLSRSDLIEIENEGFKALQEYLASRTVIITSKTQGFHHGTGVAVRYGNQDYLLTAAHVLDGEPDNDKILVVGRPDSPLKELQKDQLPVAAFGGSHSQRVFSTATYININQRLVGQNGEDIAALGVLDAGTCLPHTVFHNLYSQGDTDVSGGQVVTFCGFPGELAQQVEHRVTRERGAVGYLYLVQEKIRNISAAPYKLDPDVHFVTDFTPDDKACDPKGMSGCGVWSFPRFRQGQIWFPHESQLLGIQVGCYPTTRLLQIVRIGRVLDLLSG